MGLLNRTINNEIMRKESEVLRKGLEEAARLGIEFRGDAKTYKSEGIIKRILAPLVYFGAHLVGPLAASVAVIAANYGVMKASDYFDRLKAKYSREMNIGTIKRYISVDKGFVEILRAKGIKMTDDGEVIDSKGEKVPTADLTKITEKCSPYTPKK